jgi:lysophospholipase L1-like esterase
MKERLRLVLLSLASAALALAIAEGIVRLVIPPLPHVKVHLDSEPDQRRQQEIEEGHRFQVERDALKGLYVWTPTGLRLRANAIGDIRRHYISGQSVTVRTNSLGYRNRELGVKRRRRVLFLGDSITVSEYVEDDDTFVRMVEKLSEDGPWPYETVNAGVGGISLANQLAILVETGLRSDPDVVVLDFYLNDALPPPAVWHIPPPSWLEWSRLVAYALSAFSHLRDSDLSRERAAFEDEIRKWAAQVEQRYPTEAGHPLRDRRAFNSEILRNIGDWGSGWAEGAWLQMLPIFKEFRRLADLHGFELRVVCFPVRHQVEAEFLANAPQQRLANLTADLGIPYLDLLPVFRKAYRAIDEPIYYDHCHPTPRGSRIVAQSILEFLRAHDTE